MKLGFLFRGDTFRWLYDGEVYKAGKADEYGYVHCTNQRTHKVCSIDVDADVEPIHTRREQK